MAVVAAVLGTARGAERPAAALEPGAAASLAGFNILYIRGDGPQGDAYAAAYRALFEDFGAQVTVLHQSLAGVTDFAPYSHIVVGHDTSWSTEEPEDVSAAATVVASGRVVYGIGVGGALFFDAAGIAALGWLHGAYALGHTGMHVVNPLSPVWSGRNPIAAEAGDFIELYREPVDYHVRDLLPEEGADPLEGDPLDYEGMEPGQVSYASILTAADPRYRLWGGHALPTMLTTAGRFALTNHLAFRALPYRAVVPMVVAEP
jgi:hypothetical protein